MQRGEDKAQKLRAEMNKGQLYNLDPILTDDGIIRVEERLWNAPRDVKPSTHIAKRQPCDFSHHEALSSGIWSLREYDKNSGSSRLDPCYAKF